MTAEEAEAAIIREITRLGKNKSNQPYSTWWDQERWWIMVEVNTRKATFDVETNDPDKIRALRAALRRIRFNISTRAA